MAQGVVLHQVFEIHSVAATALTVAPSRVSVLFCFLFGMQMQSWALSLDQKDSSLILLRPY